MFKRPITFCMLVFVSVIIVGCASPRPEFNQNYLPNVVPGKPETRIELTSAVLNSNGAKTSISESDLKALPLTLYWIDDDTLIFSIYNKDGLHFIQSLLVTRNTGKITVLSESERDALLGRLGKKTVVDKQGNALFDFFGVVLQASITIAAGGGGGPGGGTDFQTSIESNGFILDIDAKIKSKILPPLRSFYDCNYTIKNRQTGEKFSGSEEIRKVEGKKESLAYWLKTWKVSPDGRSYLIGRSATLIKPDNGEAVYQKLVENYSFVSLDISPQWNRIVLLVFKQDEKTNQTRYWFEFYPFTYGRK